MAIEYSSDVLLGLQLDGVGKTMANGEPFNATEAKKKNPRAVELLILKNRNGQVGTKIKFRYYPMYNFFELSGVE